jgi:hypothetical protein
MSNPESALDKILQEIRVERERQDLKWGGPAHDDQHGMADWIDYIEQRLEVIVRHQWSDPLRARKKFLQIAAIAIAAVESFDRKGPL